MAEPPATGPLVVGLDAGRPDAYRSAVAPWLATTATLQGAYARLLVRTTRRVGDPRVREWMTGLQQSARQHGRAVDELYAAFEVERPVPRVVPVVAGFLLGGAKHVVGAAEGRLAGASSGVWRDLRQLLLANLDATSAFAVVEQLGLAYGRPRVVEIVFPVNSKKSEQQLLLQELFLEQATDALR